MVPAVPRPPNGLPPPRLPGTDAAAVTVVASASSTGGIVAANNHQSQGGTPAPSNLAGWPWIDVDAPAGAEADADRPSLAAVLDELRDLTGPPVRAVVRAGSAGPTLLAAAPWLALDRRRDCAGFHALRHAFISVADRDLMLPPSLTKRLVNHSRPQDVTEGYAADWTMKQLRDPAQRIADRIDSLILDGGAPPAARTA